MPDALEKLSLEEVQGSCRKFVGLILGHKDVHPSTQVEKVIHDLHTEARRIGNLVRTSVLKQQKENHPISNPPLTHAPQKWVASAILATKSVSQNMIIRVVYLGETGKRRTHHTGSTVCVTPYPGITFRQHSDDSNSTPTATPTPTLPDIPDHALPACYLPPSPLFCTELNSMAEPDGLIHLDKSTFIVQEWDTKLKILKVGHYI
ncbi:hypothetical protein M422DRAFT_267291 [Sphaerobolus stellatus SS14]|uniref:Uncharacterized protein n=1 Tax=Sphaerobolus stellatus (strain SS14) TaxID=990650 RepID=A0A0C9V0Y7_SPHS4|nr:hypothetical protein M422DRAFT_267291 [Sphaerobolus stellatus SS14]